MTADPVNNLEAEQILLGSCMTIWEPEAYRITAGVIAAADWYRPAHATIWEAIGALRTAGLPVDPVLVLEQLAKAGQVERVGGAPYLHTLMERAVPAAMLEPFGRLVADAATRRRLQEAGARIAQRAAEMDADPVEIVQSALTEVAAARDERVGVDVLTVGWDAFLHSTAQDRPMVLPGLLGEGDRMLLTGFGGLGKSTLLRQMIVCAAAGMSPFDYLSRDPVDPIRTSIIDCENPDHRLKTALWPMVKACRDAGLDPAPNLTLGGHGYSMDLLNPRVALSLLRTIEHDKPQLLYLGPLYKLHNADPDKEVVVKQITAVLEAIREMGVALVMEAHPNKAAKSGGPMSPSGAAMWEWWPEFGLGLRLDPDSDETVRRCKLERWRIDRDENEWPLYVQASDDVMPWKRSTMLAPIGGAGDAW